MLDARAWPSKERLIVRKKMGSQGESETGCPAENRTGGKTISGCEMGRSGLHERADLVATPRKTGVRAAGVRGIRLGGERTRM